MLISKELLEDSVSVSVELAAAYKSSPISAAYVALLAAARLAVMADCDRQTTLESFAAALNMKWKEPPR